MAKTEVLIITPGMAGESLRRELDVAKNIKDEYLVQYQPYIDALKNYEFKIISWVEMSPRKTRELVAQVRREWPNISYAIYVDPQSCESAFYYPHGFLQKSHAGIGDLIDEFDRAGIPSHPVTVDYDDCFREITLKGVYRTALEEITSIPRVIYRNGCLKLPETEQWIADAQREIYRYLRRRPSTLHDLSPRDFERLIASIFKTEGFDVELTPETRDGGYDILAIENRKLTGHHRILVECKRYARANKVGVGVVQRLVGAVNLNRATKGVLVTTSTFTRDAKLLAEDTKSILSLRDFESIVGWLEQFTNPSRSGP